MGQKVMETNMCLFFFSFSFFFKYLQILSWPGGKVATALTASTHQREQWSQFKSKLMPGLEESFELHCEHFKHTGETSAENLFHFITKTVTWSSDTLSFCSLNHPETRLRHLTLLVLCYLSECQIH